MQSLSPEVVAVEMEVVLDLRVVVAVVLVEQELYVQFQLADQHLIQLQLALEVVLVQMVMFQL